MLLYNPVTKHTIVRRTFRVLGPVRQGETQLTYEAGYDDPERISHFNTESMANDTVPTDDVITITETEKNHLQDCPELLEDDSDSESDDEENQTNINDNNNICWFKKTGDPQVSKIA